MSEQNQFDWVDFYKELSCKLLQYKNNRLELVEKVKKIYEITGLNLPTLEKDKMLRAISDVAYARGDYETEMEQDALQSEAEKKI